MGESLNSKRNWTAKNKKIKDRRVEKENIRERKIRIRGKEKERRREARSKEIKTIK
jgi:hypothetical protein